MSDAHDLYQKLRRMAESPQASDTERSVARQRMAKLLAAHGAAALDESSWSALTLSAYDVQLVAHSAATHGVRVERQGDRLRVSGRPDRVDQVRKDWEAYAERLREMLKIATVACLNGFGIYHEGGAPMSNDEAPSMPVEVQGHMQKFFTGAMFTSKYFKRPDYTLRQLPAPERGPTTLEVVLRKYPGFEVRPYNNGIGRILYDV